MDKNSTGMNRSLFEMFVSDKLNNEYIPSVAASTGSLDFTIESISDDVTESMGVSSSSETSQTALISLIIGGIICCIVSTISLCIIINHFLKKRRKRAEGIKAGPVPNNPPAVR